MMVTDVTRRRKEEDVDEGVMVTDVTRRRKGRSRSGWTIKDQGLLERWDCWARRSQTLLFGGDRSATSTPHKNGKICGKRRRLPVQTKQIYYDRHRNVSTFQSDKTTSAPGGMSVTYRPSRVRRLLALRR